MIKTQLRTDKFAITLSLLCVLHCFFVPAFVILYSGFLSFSIDNESIHQLIVLTAVPISIFALSLGYKNHKSTSSILPAILGLLMFIFAVVLGENKLGEIGEKTLTFLGSVFIAYSHFINYQTCRNVNCSCHEDH
tara:strand:- start:110574 stop:110978 length:405 start_codon:yes stop_codon:yes gene_type:complete